jgi:TetR/AcrR family transcriptional regulator, transcriptional repressor for nem operon
MAGTRDRILDAAEQLVQLHGFSATSIDAVLEATPTSKGAFFHHFRSKAALGQALVSRYADRDVEVLEQFLAAAEAASDDPAWQLVHFVRLFEEAVDELALQQPGCLFVSFLYGRDQVAPETRGLIRDAVRTWRTRLLGRLRTAALLHPPVVEVDLESLADQVFTVFEGGFILARAEDDPTRLRAQLTHLRTYLTLLFCLSDESEQQATEGPRSRLR